MGLLLRLSFFLARSFGDQSSRLWAPAQLIPKPLGQVTAAVQCGQVTAAAAADSLSPQRADMLEVHVMPPHLELLWASSNCLIIFRGKAPPSPALRCCPFPLACPEIHLNELQARVWDSLGRAGHLSNLQLLEKKEATHGPGFVPGARNTGSLKNSGGSLGTQQDLTPLPVSRCLSCTTLSETRGRARKQKIEFLHSVRLPSRCKDKKEVENQSGEVWLIILTTSHLSAHHLGARAVCCL